MEATWTKLLTSTRRWVLLLIVVLSGLTTLVSSAQTDINDDPLPTGRKKYRDNITGFFPMHDHTSKSLVLIKASTLYSSGYFIQTDPSLNYYCLVTAAHSLTASLATMAHSPTDDLRSSFNISNLENVPMSLSFGVVYIGGDVAGFERYVVDNLDLPVSTTVAAAVYGKLGKPDWVDYAVVKVPKANIWEISPLNSWFSSLRLHGIEFLNSDILPANRLSNDPQGAMYSIHHAEVRPQQISTLTKSRYVAPDANDGTKPIPFLGIWAMPNWNGLLNAASGAPLVLPRKPANNGVGNSTDYDDAPAIGIVIGDVVRTHGTGPQRVTDDLFFKLSYPPLANVIQNECTKNLDQKKYSKSRVVSPLREAVKSTVSALADMAKQVDALNQAALEAQMVLPMDGALGEEGHQVKKKIDELLVMINDNSSDDDVNIKLAYGKVDKEVHDYLPILSEAIRVDRNKNNTYLNRVFANYDMYAESPWKIPHGVQIVVAKMVNDMTEAGKSFGVPFSSTAIAKKVVVIPKQMKAPEELVNLRSSVIALIEFINDRYEKLTEYTSDNKAFFQGVERFYLNEDDYSNLFLLGDFYEDEYTVTNLVIKNLEDDLKKAQAVTNMGTFAIDFATKLATIKEMLAKLKDKNYPAGFLTFPADQLKLSYEYYNFLNSSTKFKITPKTSPGLLNWQDLDLRYEANNNSFGYKDILAGATIDRLDYQNGFETHQLNVNTKEFHSCYSTKFKLMGSLDLNKIKPTVHPNLQQFMEQNTMSLTTTGKLAQIKPNSKETIAYTYVFDRDKLPRVLTNALTTRITKFIKTQTEVPQLNLSTNFTSGVVKVEINTPEVLVISRAFKKVEVGIGSNKGYITSERNDANEYLGQNFVSMASFIANSLNIKYRVKLNDKIGWDCDLVLPAPVAAIVPGRYRIASRAMPGNAKTTQYMQPGQPSADHRRYSELPWVEYLGAADLNNAEQVVKVELNPDGTTYSLTHEGTRAGQYLGRLVGNYAQAVNGIAQGLMVGYSTAKDGPEQKWTIRPSSTSGYYQIINENATADNTWYLTAEYDTDYQASMVSLYRKAYTQEQDWVFEPVLNGSRVAAPETPQLINAEDQTIPTLHPNPVSDQLQVNLPAGYESGTIMISNVGGSSLNLPVRQQGHQRVVDVRPLQPGMYFIQIQAEGKPKHTLKFLKQ